MTKTPIQKELKKRSYENACRQNSLLHILALIFNTWRDDPIMSN